MCKIEKVRISLTLDEESNNTLTKFSEKTKINKSSLMRKILNHFNKYPQELSKLLLLELEENING